MVKSKFNYNKWCPDYENNKIVRYDKYIRNISKEDINNVSYFQGSFSAACKYFGIDGTESIDIVKAKEYIVNSMFPENNEAIADKRDRLFNKVVWYQNSDKTLFRTSAEIFDLILIESLKAKTYLDQSIRDNIARQIIYFAHSVKVPFSDRFILNKTEEISRMSNRDIKRFLKLQNYYKSNEHKEYFCEIVPLEEIKKINIFS